MASAPIRGESGTAPPKKKGKKKVPAGGGGGNPQNKGSKKKAPKKGSAPKRPRTNRVLNPPFDERMRRVGGPQNQAKKIKRGWILGEDTGDRINFLFNPSGLDVGAAMDPSAVRSPNQMPDVDQGSEQFLTNSGLSLSFKLLYDRTYELYSGGAGAASQFGVFSDVAAWYQYHGMIPDMPSNWEEGYILEPMRMVTSFLFIGPRLAYYGYASSINVAYSHWTQDMIPARCAVDVSFNVLPYNDNVGKLAKASKADSAYIGGRGWGYDDLPDRGGIPSVPSNSGGGSGYLDPGDTPSYYE